MYDPIPEDEQIVGVRVVCFSTGGAGVQPSVRVSKISKVNDKTFRVENENDPFPRDSCERRGAGRWSANRHVTLASSLCGEQMIRGMRNRNADAYIANAYHDWEQHKSDDAGRDKLEYLQSVIERVLKTAPKYVVDTEE